MVTKAKPWNPWMPASCAIAEVTADGAPCGRCFYLLQSVPIQVKGLTSCDAHKVCPRHGDVTEAQAAYVATGKITRSDELQRRG